MLAPKSVAATLAITGLIAWVSGLLWGVCFVGVPTPDPTPGMEASEAFHLQVSGWLMAGGSGALLGSLTVALLARWRQGAGGHPTG